MRPAAQDDAMVMVDLPSSRCPQMGLLSTPYALWRRPSPEPAPPDAPGSSLAKGVTKVPINRSIVGLLLAAVGLTACENLPYYDESLDLFSRSRYDPEVEAIEQRTPPPENSPVLSAPTGAAAIAPLGGGALSVAAAGIGDPRDAPAPALAAAGVARVDRNRRDQNEHEENRHGKDRRRPVRRDARRCWVSSGSTASSATA